MIKKIKFYWQCFKYAWAETNKLSEADKQWYRDNNTIYNNAKWLRK